MNKLLLITLITFTSCLSESKGSAIFKKGYIGESITTVTSEIGQLFPDQGCKPDYLAKLEKRFGPEPHCYITKHKLIGGIKSIEVFTSKDIVKEFRTTWYDSTPRRNNFKVFPKVSSFFGEKQPTHVIKQNANYGNYPAYTATWVSEEGITHAFMICPMVLVGENWVEVKRGRDCALQKLVIQTKISEPLNNQFKGKAKEY